MKKLLYAAFAAAILLADPAAAARIYNKGLIQLRDPWTRATPPGAEVAAGYVEIRNTGKEADRLVAASSPAAARVELHVMSHDGGVMKMREAPGFPTPPRKTVTLKPGGSHLMLTGLKQPFLKGQHIPITLRFERAGEVHVELEVRASGAAKPHH
jgi:periplasmic copper chaperone A